LTADGVVSLIGCMMEIRSINAVYIGHPGWKAIGGRIGYSAATGVMVLSCPGSAFLPADGIDSGRRDFTDPAHIGMLIGAQAFRKRRSGMRRR